MKRLFLLLYLAFAIQVQAQTSLDTLRDVGNAYVDSMKYDQALQILGRGLTIARSDNKKLAEAYFLIDIGYAYAEQNDLRRAKKYFEEAASLGEAIGDDTVIAHSKLNLGIVEKQKGNYTHAINHLTTAVAKFSEIKDTELQASAYNTLGDIKSKQKEFAIALEYHRKALALRIVLYHDADSLNRIAAVTDLASSFNNIGELYKDSIRYSLATVYLRKALALKKQLNDTLFRTSTIAALAAVYHAQEKTLLAKELAAQAYQIRKQFSDRIGIAASANQLGAIFLSLKDYKTAEQYIEEAIAVSQSDSINDALLEAYNLARNLYRETGQLQKALDYDNQFILQNQFLFNAENREVQEDAEARYELDKKEDENNDLEQKTKDQYIMFGGTIGFLTIILLGGGYAYFDVRRANKREAQARKEAQEAKEQIESLWKELNHRVKNNLQILSSMMSLQGMQITDELTKKTLLDMENRVKAMGVMHRKLYLDNELTLIGLDILIIDLVEDLKVTFGIPDLKMKSKIQNIELPADKAIPLGLIVNEVLTNAFKYAFANHEDPALVLELYQTQNGITLRIKDNGPGFPVQMSDNNSFGFRLISLFSKQLNGKLNMENNNGAQVTLEIVSDK
jgi:two-component system, sensor histidine kinase PdtaS